MQFKAEPRFTPVRVIHLTVFSAAAGHHFYFHQKRHDFIFADNKVIEGDRIEMIKISILVELYNRVISTSQEHPQLICSECSFLRKVVFIENKIYFRCITYVLWLLIP